LTENLPKATDDDIKVELQSPPTSPQSPARVDSPGHETSGPVVDFAKLVSSGANTIQISKSSAGSDDECLRVLMRGMTSLMPTPGETEKNGDFSVIETHNKGFKAFHCDASGNIFWAQWLAKGQMATASFKYTVTWPEERQIYIN